MLPWLAGKNEAKDGCCTASLLPNALILSSRIPCIIAADMRLRKKLKGISRQKKQVVERLAQLCAYTHSHTREISNFGTALLSLTSNLARQSTCRHAPFCTYCRQTRARTHVLSLSLLTDFAVTLHRGALYSGCLEFAWPKQSSTF